MQQRGNTSIGRGRGRGRGRAGSSYQNRRAAYDEYGYTPIWAQDQHWRSTTIYTPVNLQPTRIFPELQRQDHTTTKQDHTTTNQHQWLESQGQEPQREHQKQATKQKNVIEIDSSSPSTSDNHGATQYERGVQIDISSSSGSKQGAAQTNYNKNQSEKEQSAEDVEQSSPAPLQIKYKRFKRCATKRVKLPKSVKLAEKDTAKAPGTEGEVPSEVQVNGRKEEMVNTQDQQKKQTSLEKEEDAEAKEEIGRAHV